MQFEQLEVLFHHIPVVQDRIEYFDTLELTDENLRVIYQSENGKKLYSFFETYLAESESNQKHTIPDISRSFVSEVPKYIEKPYYALHYLYEWSSKTAAQLMWCKSLDIRCSQPSVIRYLSLFVQYAKLSFFCSNNQLMRFIGYAQRRIDYQGKLYTADECQKVVDWLRELDKDPRSYIQKTISRFSLQLKSLASSTELFLTKYLSDTPNIDWSDFSIFKHPPSPESTLPSNEFWIATHMPLLYDSIFFMVCVFNELLDESKTIRSAIISESREFYISKSHKLDSCWMPFKTVDLRPRKSRVIHISILLEELVDFCTFEPDHLPTYLKQAFALAGLAAYDIRNDLPSPEISELSQILLSLFKLVQNHIELIKRFYIFNLASIDCDFLEQLIINQRSDDRLIHTIHKNLQSIDFLLFDKGYHFSFEILLIAIGKVLHNNNRSSPLYEHMSTVYEHALIANDPLKLFLDRASIPPQLTVASSISGTPALLDICPNSDKVFNANVELIIGKVQHLIKKCSNPYGNERRKYYNIFNGEKNDLVEIFTFCEQLPSRYIQPLLEKISISVFLDKEIEVKKMCQYFSSIFEVLCPIFERLDVSFTDHFFNYIKFNSSLSEPEKLLNLYEGKIVPQNFKKHSIFQFFQAKLLSQISQKGELYSSNDLETIFDYYGPQLAASLEWYLINTISQCIAKVVGFVFSMQEKLRFMELNYQKTGAVDENLTVFEMLKNIGYCIWQLELCKEAAGRSFDNAIPGFCNSVREESEDLRIIQEMVGVSNAFVRINARQLIKEKLSNANLFFFLIASAIGRELKKRKFEEKEQIQLAKGAKIFSDIASEIFVGVNDEIIRFSLENMMKAVLKVGGPDALQLAMNFANVIPQLECGKLADWTVTFTEFF